MRCGGLARVSMTPFDAGHRGVVPRAIDLPCIINFTLEESQVTRK